METWTFCTVMHDVLEGTTQLTLKCLLHHLIENKYFRLATLNERIPSFDYGQAEISNKPSEISRATYNGDSNTLKQSGVYNAGDQTEDWQGFIQRGGGGGGGRRSPWDFPPPGY